jgi:hypothetical protein
MQFCCLLNSQNRFSSETNLFDLGVVSLSSKYAFAKVADLEKTSKLP